jgi:HK97 family phage major capsid protein
MPTMRDAYDKMEAILLKARQENRGLTGAEIREFDRLENEFYSARLEDRSKPRDGYIETRGVSRDERTADDIAFTRYLRTGDTSGLQTRADGTGFSTAPNDAGLSAGSNGDYAGYLVPQGFWANLQVAQKAYGGIANDFKEVVTDSGNPMPWPTIDPTGVSASLLGASSELTQLSVTQPYNFGQGMLNAWTIYGGPYLASLQLVQDSAFDVDEFVAARAGEAIGRKVASLAVSGTGSGQPLGLITALAAKGASSGASGGYVALGTATDVPIFGNYSSPSTTELVGNVLAPATLVKMVQAVDPAYYTGAKFYMNATQAWNLRTVTDGNGRPIIDFMNGFDADTVTGPDYNSNAPIARLLGFPVVVDNNIPNLTASTVGGPVFGNLSPAMVYRKVRSGATLMRLNERYADYLAVGYLAFWRFDLRSNDLRAACTVQVQAS